MSPDEAGRWMATYYLKPDPDSLVDVVKGLSSSEALKGQRNKEGISGWWQRLRKNGPMAGYAPPADEPVIAFLAKVFAQNPEKIAGWLEALHDLPQTHQRTLWIAAWSSGAPHIEAVLRARGAATSGAQPFIEALLQLQMRPVEQVPLTNATILDMQWTAFCATGDERYVHRVVEALGLVSAPQGTPAFAMGAAALWSLQSNAKQHERVRDICAALLPQTRDGMKSLLESIVSGAPVAAGGG